MLAAGALPDQLRRLIEQLPKRGDVAGDDRIGGPLELRVRRAGVLQRINMQCEFRPARKSVSAGDQKLRVGELGDVRRTEVPFDAIDLIGRSETFRPFAKSNGIAGSLDEILRQFLVVAEVRMGRKRKGV